MELFSIQRHFSIPCSHGGSSSAALRRRRRRRHSSQTKGDLTRWGGREGASMGGEREGAGPLPAAGLGLPLRAPSRSGPRLPCRPPQPHAQVHKSARFLRPPRPFPGRRRRLLCEAARSGPGGCRVPVGAPRALPSPCFGPRKGWVGGRPSEVSSTRFLRNCDGSPASVFCCFSPFFLLPVSSLPFPPLLTPPKAKKTSETCGRRRLLGL